MSDKYVPHEQRVVKDRLGNERTIQIPKLADRPPCKGCGEEPRSNGSAFGKGCSELQQKRNLNDSRLQRKIAEQMAGAITKS